METRTLTQAEEVRRATRKTLGAEILFDLAYDWHAGEKPDFAYIASRIAMLAGLSYPDSWKAAQESAGAQVEEDQADADAAAESDDFDILH